MIGLPRWHSGKESSCNAGDSVRSLGQEEPLEKEVATHSSILAWKNPMDRGAWWATVYGIAESDMTERVHTHTL